MEAGANHHRGIRTAPVAAASRPAASPGEDVLHLVNTMSRRKEPFRPRQHPPADLRAAAQPVKVFTCGPSIYRRPHIGNYRTFLFEDVLVRYLEYLGYAVQRVINFTDVEDKTIREAVDQGQDVRSLTRKVEEQFYRETDLLRIRLPPFIPRSSTCVPQAVRIILALLERGIRRDQQLLHVPVHPGEQPCVDLVGHTVLPPERPPGAKAGLVPETARPCRGNSGPVRGAAGRRPGQSARTARAATTKWRTAAATTRAWKTSW